eukprot:502220-Hanusia_phi.AAC.1
MDSIREAIEAHMEAARDAMNLIARSTETQLNQRRRLPSFQVGDQVWLSTANIAIQDQTTTAKLQPLSAHSRSQNLFQTTL